MNTYIYRKIRSGENRRRELGGGKTNEMNSHYREFD